MTSFEVSSLIISAFSAIGTVGAVAIALWATLHKRKRFNVKDIYVRGTMGLPEGYDGRSAIFTEGYVGFLIENRQEFQLEVLAISLSFSRGVKKGHSGLTGMGFGDSLRGNFIPAQSQYTVKLDVLGSEIPFSQEEVGKITCEIETSAGDVVVPFPDKWRDLLFGLIVFSEA